MKKSTFLGLLLLVAVCSPALLWARPPVELAGFVLGGQIEHFTNKVQMDTVIPVRYLESLKEVETKDVKGFKTGLLVYNTCVDPSRVVRLKFKYADNSKKFFEALLKRYKESLGEPNEWRGDPFHIVLAWKWHVTDDEGNRISIILQHNTRDEEEKQGNVVKMTVWNLILEEERCFEHKHPQSTTPPKFTFTDPGSVDWEPLIPR